jgi:hypothetical protein
VPHTRWTVFCDAPSCGATCASEEDVSRAGVRKFLAGRGWTSARRGMDRNLDIDLCPEHKPPEGGTE